MDQIKYNIGITGRGCGICSGIIAILYCKTAYLQTVGHAGMDTDPIYFYLFFAGIFIAGVLLFSNLKQKEERERNRRRTKSLKQAHFVRYERQHKM